jgi:hypothetical protein
VSCGNLTVGAIPERLDMEYLNRFSTFQQFRATEEDMEKGNTASATSQVLTWHTAT